MAEGGSLDQPHFLGRDNFRVPLGTLSCCLRKRERPSLEVAVQLGGERSEDDVILDGDGAVVGVEDLHAHLGGGGDAAC